MVMNLRTIDIIVISVIAIVITVSLITMGMMPREGNGNLSKEKPKNLSDIALAPASEPVLVDVFSSPINRVVVNDQILVQSEITNKQDKRQPFVYVVQVKNSEGITVSLSWMKSELLVSEKLKAAQLWTPDTPGKYDIEIFVWGSIEGQTVLSPSKKILVEVAEF